MSDTPSFKSPHSLMIQGTTSDAGKSVMAAAFCRILKRHAYSVAPFKPQNMALNSAVTAEGGEIGRAQAVQAEACGIEPNVLMNPVLLKPNSDTGAQVIVLGKAVGNLEAWGFHKEKPNLLKTVVQAHDELAEQYKHVIIEGAGSPAEINLRDNDIANMGFAEAADCPVIIVADIDRGGVFAHLYGTYELLSESEKNRVVGFLINRFRGDASLLDSGLKWLEEKTTVPVLGVVPYLHDLHVESEDSVQFQQVLDKKHSIKVVVIAYPRMSNHTDFDVLRLHPNIDCEYIRDPNKFTGADIIILPGSKHVRADLAWLNNEGWDTLISKHLRFQGKLIGICGGYQMLGKHIHDPLGIESSAGSSEGLGYLDMQTELTANKALCNVVGELVLEGYTHGHSEVKVRGYEIHAGRSEGLALKKPVFKLKTVNEQGEFVGEKTDGAISDDNQVLGTYLHGLFDEAELLKTLLQWSGFAGELHQAHQFDYKAVREKAFDRLADAVEEAVGMDVIKDLMRLGDID